MLRKRSNSRVIPEINAGSMADIAFLLLIFFLVTSQIASNKGLLVKLPPYAETPPLEITETRNLYEVAIKSDGTILGRNTILNKEELKSNLKQFVLNPSKDPLMSSLPSKAIVSISHDPDTKYEKFIEIYNVLLVGYNEIRNEQSKKYFNKDFKFLNKEEGLKITKDFPILISEAEFAK
jgi:biopolymer transport protein ExbD